MRITLGDALMENENLDSSNPKSIEIDHLICQIIALTFPSILWKVLNFDDFYNSVNRIIN